MRLSFFLVIFAALALVPAARADATVVVKGMKQDGGLLLVAVYANRDTWLGKEPLVGLNVAARRDANGVVVVKIPGDLPAEVSVAVIHDLNGNQDMDRNRLGIPLEPYGFSKGVRPRFRAPRFEEALAASSGPIEITVDTLL